MQLTKTEYNAGLLEKWKADAFSGIEINNLLQKFLVMFNVVFGNTMRVKNFGVYIKGLLSNPARKLIEPIALEYMGESGVRSCKISLQDLILMMKYCGRLGKTESCQAGVFAIYAGEKGCGIVDRKLYIPKEWFDD